MLTKIFFILICIAVGEVNSGVPVGGERVHSDRGERLEKRKAARDLLQEKTALAAQCLISTMATAATRNEISSVEYFPKNSNQIDSNRFSFDLPMEYNNLPKNTGDLFTIRCMLESHLRRVKIEKIERLSNDIGIRVQVAGIKRKCV